MAKDGFKALADVWVPPKPRGSKYYKSEWTKKLFACIVRVDPRETDADDQILNVRLEDCRTRELIANVPYDGSRGIISVNDSARHYVVTIRGPTCECFLGIEFRDPSDSIDFSLAIQSFMRRRMFSDRQGWPTWSTRKTANLRARRPRSNSTAKAWEEAHADGSSSSDEGSDAPEAHDVFDATHLDASPIDVLAHEESLREARDISSGDASSLEDSSREDSSANASPASTPLGSPSTTFMTSKGPISAFTVTSDELGEPLTVKEGYKVPSPPYQPDEEFGEFQSA